MSMHLCIYYCIHQHNAIFSPGFKMYTFAPNNNESTRIGVKQTALPFFISLPFVVLYASNKDHLLQRLCLYSASSGDTKIKKKGFVLE